MKAKPFVSIWILLNLIILLQFPFLFYLGLLWPVYWETFVEFNIFLIVTLFFHILYQGFFIGGAVAMITIGIMAWQRLTRQTVPILYLCGEICVILLGFFDISPIAIDVIPQLYPLLPGW